jgi:hypothetical protein
MRKCRDCDFPRKFARFFDWRSDGTIISTDRTKTRSQITLLEAGEIESLFADLSGTIGINVDRFLIQAQKNIGKAIYANLPIRHMKRVPASRFFRPQWLARLLVKVIAGDIAGLGDGRVSLERYVAGEAMVLRFADPVVPPLLVGSAAGIYESIEEMPIALVDYRIESSGDLVIDLSHGTDSPGGQERLYLEDIRPGEGPVSYDRCLDCGVPRMAARTFSWDIDRGIIRNRRTGGRDVVVAVQSVNAILRELEAELGEEIPRLVYEHQRAVTLKRLEGAEAGEAAEFLDGFLADMALRGLGYPTAFTFTGSDLMVEISNAYNQVLYAAKLAAALEKVTGTPSLIEWKRREQYAGEFTISTRRTFNEV